MKPSHGKRITKLECFACLPANANLTISVLFTLFRDIGKLNLEEITCGELERMAPLPNGTCPETIMHVAKTFCVHGKQRTKPPHQTLKPSNTHNKTWTRSLVFWKHHPKQKTKARTKTIPRICRMKSGLRKKDDSSLWRLKNGGL